MSPVVESMGEATVDVLIDPETKQWNNVMLEGLFTPQEAEIIKKIPLARIETKDNLYWPLSHDGKYTCKSGYRFLKEEAEPVQERTPLALETQLWKKIWLLQISNKVKNHVWRACRDSLPTKQNLMRCTIISNTLYDRCKELPETTLHAVWTCPKLDEVWTFRTKEFSPKHKFYGLQRIALMGDTGTVECRAIYNDGVVGLDSEEPCSPQ